MLAEYRDYIYHCLKCGACRVAYPEYTPICPSGERFSFDSYYAIGRMEIARAILEGRLEFDEKVAHRVFTCTNCGGCDEQCRPAVGNRPLLVIEELKSELVERGYVPHNIRVFLTNMRRYGNPYQAAREKWGEWAGDGLIKDYDGDEYLLYVGPEGAFDPRGQRIARALAALLGRAGVSFGCAGGRETSDGNEVNRVGEKGLFQMLAEENIQTFKELGVKKIITLSPHAYNTFKNDYPELGVDFQTVHYTQLLRELIKGGRLSLAKGVEATVTYHDPCYLGRFNGDYGSAREVLGAVPGVRLVEMERSGRNSFCCSGGGANYYADLLGGGANNPTRLRVREAYGAGAGILAVACPGCAIMLGDAPAAEGLDDRLAVRDVAEIVLEAVEAGG